MSRETSSRETMMSSEPKRAGQPGADTRKARAPGQDGPHDTVVPATPVASTAPLTPSGPSFQPPSHPAGTGSSTGAMGSSSMSSATGSSPATASIKDAAAEAGDALKRGAEQTRTSVQDAALSAAAAARKAADDLRSQASGAGEAIRGTASDVLSSVTDQATGVAEDLKARGADAAGGVVQALRSASGELDKASPMVAGYVREAADAADRAINDLRQRPVQDLAADAVAFAKRQPVAFFAGAVILGFVASRFLRTSAPMGAPYPAGPYARRDVRPDEFV